MSEAFGAFANVLGTAVTADQNQKIAQNWQDLTQEQQQFLRDQLSKIEGIQAPQFNTGLPPPQQLALERYLAPLLAQGQQVSIDPNDRAMQMEALNRLQGLAGGAYNSEINAANYKAMQNAAQQQAAQNGAIQQKLAAQGTLGSGQELAAKMQAAQNGANNSQAGMLQAAQNAALQRLQANNQYLEGIGNLRGQDTSLASRNADIINQFNLANTNARNRINEMNTGIGNQQSVYNNQQNNAYQQALVNLQNNIAQQKYQDQLGQAQAAAGEANVISGNAMDAGKTQGALNANTASTIAKGIGDTANSAYGAYKNISDGSDPWSDVNGNDYTNATVENKPKENENEEYNFDGT
jgi:hypothetical protein